MKLELAENHKIREDIYMSKIIKKDSEIDLVDKKIIKNILSLEISDPNYGICKGS
jgi:hypothetical protein